nr:hypothetical protein [Tanacetum cinerariifolium]
MDADEIWLLLKEQAMANQQQAKALQAQLVKLQLELHATKNLMLPHSMWLDVPKFISIDPETGVNRWPGDYCHVRRRIAKDPIIVNFNREDYDVDEEHTLKTGYEEAIESEDILILNSSHSRFCSTGSGRTNEATDQEHEALKVYIVSGETLLCGNLCAQVTLEIQGLCMKVDLYVHLMKRPNILLEIQ